MKTVKMEWAAQNAHNINLIDVRTPAEYQVRHVDGAKNIPLAGLLLNHESLLDKSQTYYLMCHSGGRSGKATEDLAALEYDVYNCEGGIIALKD